MKTVILASKSPRRLEILRKHGIEPVVLPSETEEILPEEIGMREAVEMLAEQKAAASYDIYRRMANFACSADTVFGTGYDFGQNEKIIIGADTIVYKDEIMGKPVDEADAFRMLSRIRNTSHYVVTGVCIINAETGERNVLSDVTEVFCKNYTDDEIRAYIASGEPMDKAGAYAIQGLFGPYIDRIEGDYENVVGLPFHCIEPYM